MAQPFFKDRHWGGVTRIETLAIYSSISRYEKKMLRSCTKDGLVLAVIGRCALVARLGWAVIKVRQAKVNFTFENLEGQDEVSSKASAFQLEEFELTKAFLI